MTTLARRQLGWRLSLAALLGLGCSPTVDGGEDTDANNATSTATTNGASQTSSNVDPSQSSMSGASDASDTAGTNNTPLTGGANATSGATSGHDSETGVQTGGATPPVRRAARLGVYCPMVPPARPTTSASAGFVTLYSAMADPAGPDRRRASRSASCHRMANPALAPVTSPRTAATDCPASTRVCRERFALRTSA